MSTIDQSALVRAAELHRARRFEDAERACRQVLLKEPRSAAALHLLGLVRKDAGDVETGERLLRESIALEPHNADYHANLGNLLRRLGRLTEARQAYGCALALLHAHRGACIGLALTLRELGEVTQAERCCRSLLANNASDPKAWSTLGAILRDQNRPIEAEDAWRRALALDPRHATAHHNLGAMLSSLGRAEEALACFERAQALGVDGFELAFNRGRALVQLYRVEDAIAAFARAVAFDPAHADAHLHLAGLRYMCGDPEYAQTLWEAARRLDDPTLHLALSALLRRAGAFREAESVLVDVLAKREAQPEARSGLAQLYLETGRLEEAEGQAREAAALKPHDAGVLDNLVSILLARGKSDEALPLIRAQRALQPLHQGWIAYEAVALRLLGEPGYRELYDYARLVRIYDLEPPKGWSSVDELNAALEEALESRHVFANHPLDQSLRGGSQTARSLLAEPHPAIRALLEAFAAPIEDYRGAIGSDAEHPFSSRNTGPVRLTGAWSVQLRSGGFHVNHVHPHGWISSAYYVHTPAEVEDEDEKSGWLKFGETRFFTPGATPEKFVRPKSGRLVLFPSYMWHGTTPIHGADPRLTVAFDAAPVKMLSAQS